MSNPVKFTLCLMRGDDYREGWSIKAADTGASLIAATDTISLVIKAAAGASPALLSVDEQVDPTLTGISDINYGEGTFNVVIRAASLDAIPGGDLEQVRVSFALYVTDVDGLRTTYGYGDLIVDPEG